MTRPASVSVPERIRTERNGAMMNGDDMMMFVALLLVMSLLDMVLTMK